MRNAVPGGCSNVVAGPALVREVGGFNTELSLLADWDLWIRLALAAPAAASPRARSSPTCAIRAAWLPEGVDTT